METNVVDLLSEVETLPSMPNAAAKVISLLDDPETATSEIENAIKLDAGLTANILKLVNSAYFGLATEVGSIRRAIVLLGLKRLVQIVMTSCVNALLEKQVIGYDLPPGELWRHSIAVSVAAEGLVNELNISASEEIFTAALLHDVGKLILGKFVRQDIKEIELKASEGVAFQTAEQMVLGTDHAEIGAHILKSWSLPQEIVNAVRWHHDPDSAEETNTLIDVVHVADVLCLMIGIGVGREGLQYEPSPSVSKRLGLKSNHIEMIASQTLLWTDELIGALET
ncbi:MAG: HDOD domain-containing protein [Deltaproteobacteria bacterium]|nr:HDOD domain-containing protein [Deltaproteobacteria bacterium]